jgi:hypothetical protein
MSLDALLVVLKYLMGAPAASGKDHILAAALRPSMEFENGLKCFNESLGIYGMITGNIIYVEAHEKDGIPKDIRFDCGARCMHRIMAVWT